MWERDLSGFGLPVSVSGTLAERLLWPWTTERSAHTQSGILNLSDSLTCSGCISFCWIWLLTYTLHYISHSSLPPNLHPVVRPFIPSGRSAPGTGLQARCGLHGCLRQGLGGHVQWACSVGGLDGSPTALAYQLPRVAGSTPGLEPSQESLTRRARTGQGSRFLYLSHNSYTGYN